MSRPDNGNRPGAAVNVSQRSDRVRLWEPDPAVPAGALPVFGELHAAARRRAAAHLVLPLPFVIGGTALLFGRFGIAAPLFLVVFFGVLLLTTVAILTTLRKAVPFLRARFEPVVPAPDGLVVAGRRVGVRLPDGRWLHARMPAPLRVQLAGERRLWLLRLGDRAMVTLPGTGVLGTATITDHPLPDARPLPAESRVPAPPRHDPVLTAYRRHVGNLMWYSAAVYGVTAALAAWASADLPDERALAAAKGGAVFLAVFIGLFALIVVGRAIQFRSPVPADSWTELSVVVDRPISINRYGLVRIEGRALLPDGRTVGFRMRNVAVAFALATATTGQLWIAGAPRPGKSAIAGIPGHAVMGTARLV
ncbi:hypothetical protein [Amycolatopsis sp. SID8362]|uniref:hypothetical protein n=1 Tax=Amycolatopsis sp. SID8362 TaxID=2690346 RepID=UPI001368AB9F|nr:hypothetical protein [Amycolatopsis sp. SID8362]NBH11295.1 hypothetical protein [Amycolatopsis sp. SID8362]NED47987.1 hypothetical protein [Amycolatopsis sp. SID8362]